MNKHDVEYKKLCKYILEEGTEKTDRTGTGTKSIFGYQMRFKMSDGFPLLSLRKIHIKSLIHELLWFLGSYDDKYKKFGNTNIKYLIDNGVTFWTEWAYENYKKQSVDNYLDDDLKDEKTTKKLKFLNIKDFEERIKTDDDFSLKYGDLGPVYGKQWLNFGGYSEMVEITKQQLVNRNGIKLINSDGYKEVNFGGVNQIDEIIEQLIENPDSRRMIVSAWNPTEIDNMALPPCHMMFQFYTKELTENEKLIFPGKERKLSLQLYQRSCDVGLGLPFNIASYSILLYMISQIVNMVPDEFVWSGGDVHIYKNHFNQINELLERESYKPCNLGINTEIESIYDFRFNDINIIDYQCHPNIKMDVSV